MENKKKILIISAILIGLGGLYIYKNTKIKSKILNELDTTKVLSKGSTGAEVLELQRILLDQYGADLGSTGVEKNGIDGDFGSITETALLKAKGVKSISLKDILTKK
jgi:peptidoglycan hydrolase-like protein with peptidoglycan-binding domain